MFTLFSRCFYPRDSHSSKVEYILKQIVSVENYRTRNVILSFDDELRDGHQVGLQAETVWKISGIAEAQRALTPRRFVMPCRQLCDQNLKRVHFTCALTYLGMGCRIRRTYYGKLPNPYPLENALIILKRLGYPYRRFARLKDFLLKRIMTLVENILLN